MKILRYDSETGKLFWNPRDVDMFESGSQSAEHNAAIWNGKFAGREAFTAMSHGYKVGRINDSLYNAHRVIWKIIYNEDPIQIDHISGDRKDNRPSNLRNVDDQTNGMNKSIQSNNTTGFVGVHWDRRRSHWRAVIQVGGKQKHLGSFSSKEQAWEARKAAQEKYGYHENHGRQGVA